MRACVDGSSRRRRPSATDHAPASGVHPSGSESPSKVSSNLTSSGSGSGSGSGSASGSSSVTTRSSKLTVAPAITKPSTPASVRSTLVVDSTSSSSKYHAPRSPWMSMRTSTSLPTPASTGADPASVTFQLSSALRIANSMPFDAVDSDRMTAWAHGAPPVGATSVTMPAQRLALTTSSKRIVASMRTLSRCSPKVRIDGVYALSVWPYRRPSRTVQSASPSASQPAGSASPEKSSVRITSPGAAVVGDDATTIVDAAARAASPPAATRRRRWGVRFMGRVTPCSRRGSGCVVWSRGP
ncbi:hypothetical protein YM304_21570 [Ilumatobacter coccineus YM16-304]|uniref:Uncharacterized protein n=1 Tax=Ilumatobacter coccineus (strain NBRC 103263 / KCTC 29153 / YM16-304) TaxID=1313172 RepID=A0A6C7E7L0_ILUCY|nr:hypothetical protein YM304_21570 [Ilumatobacter coccineus YM16-304]